MSIQILIAAFAVLALIDWAQTLRIAREPELFREKWNLILPPHPSVAQVHTWFAAFTAVSVLAVLFLPVLRFTVLHSHVVIDLPWLYVAFWTVVEALAVANNIRKGIKP